MPMPALRREAWPLPGPSPSAELTPFGLFLLSFPSMLQKSLVFIVSVHRFYGPFFFVLLSIERCGQIVHHGETVVLDTHCRYCVRV